MHFHLPKPLHGWREFTGEVGIIVLGVLIALGFEQVVEAWRWRGEVREASVVLRQEITGHYENATELTMAAPCIDQQLIGLEKALLAPGPYKPVPLYKDQLEYAYRAPARDWPDDVWRSIVSEGAASHFDRKLRLQLASHYSQIATQTDLRNQGETIFFKTRVLGRPIQPDPATRAALAEELEQARGVYLFLAVTSNQILKGIDEMGMTPDRKVVAQDLATSGTLNFCRAHHLPLARPAPERPR
jgi:hypothetical protein